MLLILSLNLFNISRILTSSFVTLSWISSYSLIRLSLFFLIKSILFFNYSLSSSNSIFNSPIVLKYSFSAFSKYCILFLDSFVLIISSLIVLFKLPISFPQCYLIFIMSQHNQIKYSCIYYDILKALFYSHL